MRIEAGLSPRGNPDGVGSTVAHGMASSQLQIPGKAKFHARKIAIVATDDDVVRRHFWIGFGEHLLDLIRAAGGGPARTRKRRWNFDGVPGLADDAEILFGGEAGAGSVGGPLMLDQVGVGHDVEHTVEI